MSIEEKTIFTIFFSMFAIAVWFTSSTGNDLGLPRWFANIWACPGPLFDEDGIMRKYTKLGFSTFFVLLILAVWIFG